MSDSIRAHVTAQVQEKIAKGEALAAAIAASDEIAEAARAAAKHVATATRAALSSGWTEAELKQLGLTAGTTQRRTPRVTKQVQPKPAAQVGGDGANAALN